MDSVEKIVAFLVYSGVSITLFLILLLSKDWKKQPSKVMLVGILLNFLLVFLLMASLETKSEEWSLLLFPLVISVPYSWGPLLYFYIRSVYEADLPLDTHFFRRFFPFLAVLVFVTIPFIFHYSGLFPLPFSELFVPIGLSVAGLGMLLVGYYIYQSFKLLYKYRRLIKEHYSSLSNIDLHWVSVWVKGFFILLLLDVLLPVIALLFPVLQPLIYVEFFFFTAFIWYIGYYGINQRPVFLPEHLLIASAAPPFSEENSRKNTAGKSATLPEPEERASLFKNDSEAGALITSLHRVLAEEMLYKDENLTLRQLAEAIGTSDKKLSELLNQNLQTNFYEYVNGYRVAAFKEMVANGQAQGYTLLALAFEAGFSSKASFNRIFKQHTQQTPSQFKKKYS